MAGRGPKKEALNMALHEQKDTDIDQWPRKASTEALKEIDDFENFFTRALNKIKTRAATDAAAAADEIRSLKQAVEALHARIQIREIDLQRAEETISSKDAARVELEAGLGAKNKALQEEVAQLKRTLRKKEAEITELKNQLQSIEQKTNPPGAALNSTENTAESVQAPASSTGESSGSGSQVVATGEAKMAGATEHRTILSDIAPPAFFATAVKELSDVLGPLAAMIIKYDVERLGESMQKFPAARINELIEILSKDIPDETERARFRERLMQ